METSQHELEKMKEAIHNTQNSMAQQDEDPYLFSDDEDQEEKQEIAVNKFYAKNGQEPGSNKKKTSPPKTKKKADNSREEKGKQYANHATIEKPKSLPAISKLSVDTIRKRESAKNTTPGYEEEFPDLIVENDSFSQYREYEYKFFKSRNSSEASAVGNKTPKQNSSINTSSKEPKFFKARARSKENEKGSLVFTSPIAGAPKIKNTKAKQKKGQVSKATTGEQKGRQSRSKRKATSAVEESTLPASPEPEPEVHITRLDSRESPINSPVQLSNIDVTKSPELRPVAAALKKIDKNKGKANKTGTEDYVIKSDQSNDKTTSNKYRQKMMENIKQKMDEASGDRKQLEKTLGKTDNSVSNNKSLR